MDRTMVVDKNTFEAAPEKSSLYQATRSIKSQQSRMSETIINSMDYEELDRVSEVKQKED